MQRALINPATGRQFAVVADSTPSDVDRAVLAAAAAAADWGGATPSARSLVLLRLADLVDQHADEI